MHRDLSSLREKLETYSKEGLEAKNVCSMQQILIKEKDRDLRDKEKELRSLRREVSLTLALTIALTIVLLFSCLFEKYNFDYSVW